MVNIVTKLTAKFGCNIIVILILLPITFCFGQQPYSIEWSRCYGGSYSDFWTFIQLTNDNGCIITGSSQSNDGNVTGNHGGFNDFWTIKLDSNGEIQWEKCYGGSGMDQPEVIRNTNDGGYIIAGSSDSKDGDVTGNHGDDDWWIVKIDSLGIIQWEKSIGGSKDDYAGDIQQMKDGGYIVSGESGSFDGDFANSINKDTFPGNFWIVKLDSIGEIQWEKFIGVAGGNYQTGAISIQTQQTHDNGYIISFSSDTVDDSVYYKQVGIHYRIMKLDSNKNIQWKKEYGGSQVDNPQSIQVTHDGGYIIAGFSNSTDGDITFNHGGYDAWIVKLDSSGAMQWQKCYGGSGNDEADDIHQLNDGNYIFSGKTISNDGDVSGNHGGYDAWIVKIDSLGNLLWSKCYGGSGNEDFSTIQQTRDNNYIFSTSTESNDGDVSGNHGLEDYWVVKLYIPGPLSGSPVRFDSVTINECKVDTLLLINSGNISDTVTSVQFQGLYAIDYSIMDVTYKILLPGDTERVFVKFCPTHINVLENAIAVVLYGVSDTLNVHLSGIGKQLVSVYGNDLLQPEKINILNYPNPSSLQTIINYTLPNSQIISADIYNIFGQQINTLFNGFEAAGAHTIDYDCSQLPNGVYYLQLRTQGGVVNREMVVVR